MDLYGLRYFKDQKLFRKTKAYAQTNAFFEYLTVRDYLGPYTTSKGVARNQIKKRVDTTIVKF